MTGPDFSTWERSNLERYAQEAFHKVNDLTRQLQELRPHVGRLRDSSALGVQVGGSHYKGYAIQPVEFIHANGIPFIEGNCIKYLARWRDKGGVKDLEKVKHYVDLLIELESRTEGAST